ncbi:peptidase M24 [Helicobacter enhydrae]|uniref:Peptidase M24 n=1 Tax=Helicobacter enhydrae TaxID=222136 RepID=A0A1B1U430_9HELI|nr:aminopeptidase P family protein [Helicobacter enhydrae]ANV97509.1 peptidase M24 [Helicobacter enhydrae]
MNLYTQRLNALRVEMEKSNVDVYLVLTSDPHLSEYLPDFWKSRQWLSGFSGSQGSLVITKDYAALWADGRYWLQAEKELSGSGIELQKQNASNTYTQWLENNLLEGQTLATDFRVLPLFALENLREKLEHKHIKITHQDFITSLWNDRPILPKSLVYEHIQAPHSRAEKLSKVREKMREYGTDYHFITTLDDITWITNLRGSDVSYNPVFLAFLLISYDEVLLFADVSKFSEALIEKLQQENIKLLPYEAVEKTLESLKDKHILLDSNKMTAHLANIAEKHNVLVKEDNPSQLLKACKSKKEIEDIQEAMRHDGVALCNFFAWLEEALEAKELLSELDIDKKLTYFRAKSPLYISDSFATIAGFNANGAQPHYRATQEQFAYLQGQGLLLIDSGGQYTKGTTDITRVVPIGEPSKEQKRDYTLVLKAHIALASSAFPIDIPMPLLDSITRSALWKEQINYIHGTGHGVGYFLNVHEGPQVISYFAPPLPRTQAKIGMISSIEPGIYRAGKWGVRLENLVANQKVENPKEKDFGEFLYFETLTLCPFEISCIDTTLLSESEKTWLNQYHNKVLQELGDRVEGKAKAWLEKKAVSL